jgi:hypothetical protein
MWIIIHAFVLFVILPIVIGAAIEWIALGAAALWWLVRSPFRLWAWGWTRVFGVEPTPPRVQGAGGGHVDRAGAEADCTLAGRELSGRSASAPVADVGQARSGLGLMSANLRNA